MKHLKKVLAAAAATMAMSGSALANSPINIDGVVWTPGTFNAFSMDISQMINSGTGVVSGYGVITGISSGSISAPVLTNFCSGCALIFSFNNFIPVGATLLPSFAGTGTVIGYTGGTVNVIVSTNPTAVADAATYSVTAADVAAGGKDFLDLVGHPSGSGITFTGTADPGDGTLGGKGSLDVVGGDAANNFNTNTIPNGADLSFTNSFTDFLTADLLNALGTGNFHSYTIPEPTSVAMVGLGLLGLAMSRRRKS